MSKYLSMFNKCTDFYYNHFDPMKFVTSDEHKYNSGLKFCRYAAIWSQDPQGVIGASRTPGYPIHHDWDIKHYLEYVGKQPVVMGHHTIANMRKHMIKLPGIIIPYSGPDVDYSYATALFYMPYTHKVVFAGGAFVLREMLPKLDDLTITVFNDTLPESDDYVKLSILEDIVSRDYPTGLSTGDFAITHIKMAGEGFIVNLSRIGFPHLSNWRPTQKEHSA